MASGHEYRANRPNTWPLRPTPQSEDSSCQPGAVHTWPIALEIHVARHVGVRSNSGRVVLTMNSSHFDPKRSKLPASTTSTRSASFQSARPAKATVSTKIAVVGGALLRVDGYEEVEIGYDS
jgi:hypothetical protein